MKILFHLVSQSCHDFAHVMTAQLSWHVQNFDLIGSIFLCSSYMYFWWDLHYELINPLWYSFLAAWNQEGRKLPIHILMHFFWRIIAFLLSFTDSICDEYCYLCFCCCWWCRQWLILSNTLWPSDTIWWHRSRSILAHIMAYCLTTPKHSLNQMLTYHQWGLHLKAIPWENPKISILDMSLKLI